MSGTLLVEAPFSSDRGFHDEVRIVPRFHREDIFVSLPEALRLGEAHVPRYLHNEIFQIGIGSHSYEERITFGRASNHKGSPSTFGMEDAEGHHHSDYEESDTYEQHPDFPQRVQHRDPQKAKRGHSPPQRIFSEMDFACMKRRR